MELKFFQFYLRQLLVYRNTYVVENNGMEKKKKKQKVCKHYFNPNLLNFIVKVCLISIAARCPWHIQTFDFGHDFARVRVQCHCHCLLRFFGTCFL